MDYEKKYIEAMKACKELSDTFDNETLTEELEKIFPELKESEDERMRNAAINACKYMVDNFENSTKQYEDAIAWLEKQCEDKVEPKFHVGDKVKRKDNPHLTYILKRLTDDGIYEFHAIGKDGHEGCTCFAGVKYQDDWELVEQKPAWSEEDDKKINYLIALLQNNTMHNSALRMANEEIEAWLKSLRHQNRWKPSDEQIMALRWVLNHIPYDSHKEEISGLLEQLKKLRED